MRELLLRATSGIIYVVLILSSLYYSKLFFFLLIFVFSVAALQEFHKLISYKSRLGYYILCLLFLSFYLNVVLIKAWMVLLILVVFTHTVLIFWLYIPNKSTFNPLQKLGLSIFYLVGGCFFIVATTSLNTQFSTGTILYIFVIIWVNDTSAYCIGKLTGRRPLWKEISPNKTWEGFFGGVVFCVLTSYIFYKNTVAYPLSAFVLMGIAIPILSTFGDLIQSKFKRIANVKDSGALIPGHGGIFDRMDSIIFTAPFTYLIITIFNHVS